MERYREVSTDPEGLSGTQRAAAIREEIRNLGRRMHEAEERGLWYQSEKILARIAKLASELESMRPPRPARRIAGGK